jgi:hypothetical protein
MTVKALAPFARLLRDFADALRTGDDAQRAIECRGIPHFEGLLKRRVEISGDVFLSRRSSAESHTAVLAGI